jgi:hypothetical protein
MSRAVMGMDPHKCSATIEVMAGDETVLGDGSHATRLRCCTVCRDGVIGKGG